MYSTIARHIIYPIGEAFLGSNMLKRLKILEKTEWSPTQFAKMFSNIIGYFEEEE